MDEILLSMPLGVISGAENRQRIVEIESLLDWLRSVPPFAGRFPMAGTYRKVFRLIDQRAMAERLAARTNSVRRAEAEIVAIDGKTQRSSNTASDSKGPFI